MGFTHKWNGTVLTITSDSGTSSCDLRGEKGDTGIRGPQGVAGIDGRISFEKLTEAQKATLKGKDGYTPVKGVDYYTEADKDDIILAILDALGKSVIGEVDADNNIILTGSLVDGTYTLKYESEDGELTEIGTITIGEEIVDTNSDNLADPTSSDWAVNKRMNSSAALVDATGCHTTNYFSCKKGDIIRVKGLDIRYTNSEHTQNARAFFFKEDGNACVGTYPLTDPKVVFDGVDMFTITLDGLDNIGGGSEPEIVKGRFSGMLFSGYTANDIIITVNKEITE